MSGVLTPSAIPFTLSGSGGGTGTLYRATSGLENSYATVAEFFAYSISENVQHDLQPRNIEIQLRRASREADTMIMHRFATPLASYSEAWVGWVCDIAAQYAMERRGFKPTEGGGMGPDEARFLRRGKAAREAIKAAQDYLITPDKRLLLTESPQPATPYAAPNRGWIR